MLKLASSGLALTASTRDTCKEDTCQHGWTYIEGDLSDQVHDDTYFDTGEERRNRLLMCCCRPGLVQPCLLSVRAILQQLQLRKKQTSEDVSISANL